MNSLIVAEVLAGILAMGCGLVWLFPSPAERRPSRTRFWKD